MEVNIPDPNLEAVLRDVLDKPTGVIRDVDLAGITSLSSRERNISDLTGLEFCIYLTWLDLSSNQLKDI